MATASSGALHPAPGSHPRPLAGAGGAAVAAKLHSEAGACVARTAQVPRRDVSAPPCSAFRGRLGCSGWRRLV